MLHLRIPPPKALLFGLEEAGEAPDNGRLLAGPEARGDSLEIGDPVFGAAPLCGLPVDCR